MPFFSVIIPTYNRCSLLERAIDSVLNQTFNDYECIVIDDGSTDQTADILDIYGSKIRFHVQSNKGVSSARNRGIGMADSEYLCFLDSDDQWLPDKLQEHYRFIQNNPSLAIHQTEDIWIRNGRRVNPCFKHLKQEGRIFIASLKQCMISPSSVALRRSLLDSTGYFDENMPVCEDYDLWLRITSFHDVGLIKKGLNIRYAGSGDQLSEKYTAMDRFRIYSIIKLLNKYSRVLPPEYKNLSTKVLNKKIDILRKGAVKRKRHEFADCLNSLSCQLESGVYSSKDSLFLLQE